MESLEPRALLSTTTILTHGWQPPAPLREPFPTWVDDMAAAIDQAEGGNASIWKYDPSQQTFFLTSGPPPNDSHSSGDMILEFNWVDESDDLGGGFAEAAGEALFAALMKGGIAQPPAVAQPTAFSFVESPLHFIGHSRGAVVNSEAIERLGGLAIGVDAMTTLDPHPADGLGTYQDAVAGVHAWSNVTFADNYYQQNGSYEADFEFDGIEVPGSFNVQLDHALLDAAGYDASAGGGHSDVHLWYQGTIDLAANAQADGLTVPPNWYSGTMGPRDEIGFAFDPSRDVPRPAQGLQPTAFRQPIDSDQLAWIANGDFSYSQGLQLSDKSGYGHHGGLSDFSRKSLGVSNPYAELAYNLISDRQNLRHNVIYVPQMIDKPMLEYRVRLNHNFDDAELRFLWNGKVIPAETLSITESQGWTTRTIDLSPFAGQTGTFGFQLAGAITTTVDLDDFRIVGTPVPFPNLLLIPPPHTTYHLGERLAVGWQRGEGQTAADAQITFFWDNDQNPNNGFQQPGGSSASSNDCSTVLATDGLEPETDYYLYARIERDGLVRYAYLPHQIHITGGPPSPLVDWPDEVCWAGLDGDGDVDSADLTGMIINWTGALPPQVGGKLPSDGDTDWDGDVDSADLTALILNWTGPKASPFATPPTLHPSPAPPAASISSSATPPPASAAALVAAAQAPPVSAAATDHLFSQLATLAMPARSDSTANMMQSTAAAPGDTSAALKVIACSVASLLPV